MLALFGVDLQRLPERQLAAHSPNTHLVTIEDPDPEKAVSFPIQFDRGFNLDSTNLLSRIVEIWGDVPIALIQRLDIRHGKYGYIGLQDLTMYPLLRPGSFVQIDTELRKYPGVAVADGIRSADLFRGITGRVCVFVVRDTRPGTFVGAASAVTLQDPEICL